MNRYLNSDKYSEKFRYILSCGLKCLTLLQPNHSQA